MLYSPVSKFDQKIIDKYSRMTKPTATAIVEMGFRQQVHSGQFVALALRCRQSTCRRIVLKELQNIRNVQQESSSCSTQRLDGYELMC